MTSEFWGQKTLIDKKQPQSSFVGLAFRRLELHILINESPFHFRPGGYINKLLDLPILLTMTSRRVHLSAQRKRLRSLSAGPSFGQEVVSGISTSQRSHISHWVEEKDWPEEFFKQDAMNHLLARKKSAALLRSEGSFTTSATPSDQRPREEKNAPYKNPSYRILLEIQGDSYMSEYELGITDTSESLCQMLLKKKQPAPKDTIFRDDVFRTTCNKLQGRNEARIFQDLTPLIVPSAETLATLGAKHLDVVVESVNEGWNNCIPVTKPRPQPDYALGFRRSAFSDDQLNKLQPFIGDPSNLSYFLATYYMHFPFLTCEVICGTTGFDIADRQNAHSMTVAMKGVVGLFRRVGREQELHRQILGFSYSHDNQSVKIWGHYPVINEEKTTFWCHPIRHFDFTDRKGLEKWVAYTFTRNVYDIWVTPHLKWIRSAIDDLPPEQDFASPQQSELQPSEASGLSQQLENQALEQEPGSQSSHVDLQPITPETSTSVEKPAPKRKKA
jgi:hypothetical protein